ncbi:PBSX family phage terminase large subunit [Streptococcus suis]|uniref:PBSX family phage terminase large subunit n=1 Tax=Streptococcus suis TaxID=1307 RepID=UPI002AB56088|nr:PBSX family phage terminase large subunit [Streptococcus suis]MDY7593836.1 PBSX family phage terminase large subunit [Streptococcus suis]MDY7594773.1 PBSX family phage terminase large subunit [Streptococcus suis]
MGIDRLYHDKQLSILKRALREDWYMMINHGAVRAGKTQLDNDLFLMELRRAKKNAKSCGVDNPMYILGATSAGTFRTNILQELSEKYGIDFKFDKHGNFTLFGVYVVTTFTGSVAGLRAIRGMTAYGAYINEATLANKEVFDEIRKRCSGFGARIICDTNPDHPNHWLKKDYIDKADDKSIIANHFTIFDNTFLNQRYIENLIATTPSGMFTERGIYGRWVSGEGAVYRDFKEDMLISSKDIPTDDITIYYAGVDWGYEHHGSIVVCGQTADGRVYLLEEHSAQYQEIDYWVEIAKDIKSQYGNIYFYADSARPEHVARFEREHLKCVNADKSVLSGIEQVAKLMKQGRFFVCSEKVAKFKDEVYQYVWNEKTGEPEKKNDDVLDALRYAIYSHMAKPKAKVKRKSLFGL